mgnify:CR=1 FL=1
MDLPTEEDMRWPVLFRQEEANYAQFYSQPTRSIWTVRLYVDQDGQLESVKKARQHLQAPGVFSEDEFRAAAARGSRLGDKQYRLGACGVFSVAVGPDDIEAFVGTDWSPEAWRSIDVSNPQSVQFPETVYTLGQETTIFLLYRLRPSAQARLTARHPPPAPSSRRTRRIGKGLKRLTLG